MLNDIWLVLEILSKVVQQFVSIFNHLYILTDDPHNWGFGLWIIQWLEVFANVSQQTFVFIWVFSEDISYDDNWLLNDIWDFGFESLPQTLYTLVSHLLQFDGTPSHGPDCFPDEFDVNLLHALFQVMEDHEYIFIIGNFAENLKFFHFDVQGVMIVDKEDFQLFR